MAMQAAPRSATVAGTVTAAGRQLAGAASIDTGAMRGTRATEKLIQEHIFPACNSQVCTDGDPAGAKLLHRHGVPGSCDFPDWAPFASAVRLEGFAGGGLDASPRVTGGPIMEAALERLGSALVNCTLARDDPVCGRLVRPVVHDLEMGFG